MYYDFKLISSRTVVFLCGFLLFGSACKQKGSEISEYKLVATSDSIILPRKTLNGFYNVRPQYFYDKHTEQGYFYSIMQAPPARIMKYVDQRGDYLLLDSIDLPIECTVGGVANLGAFEVLGLDSFAISPNSWTYEHKYLIMNDSFSVVKYIPKKFQRHGGHMLWDIFDYIQAFSKNYHLGRFYFRNSNNNHELLEEHLIPRICLYNVNDTSETELVLHMKAEFASLEKGIQFRVVDDKIYAISELEHVLYVYDLVSGEELQMELKTEYLKQKINLDKNTDYYKALYESDYIKQINFNPFYEDWLFFEIHKGDEYIVDGYKKNFQDAANYLLIYDRIQHAFVGKINLPKHEGFHLFHMQPTKGGFYILFRYGSDANRYDVYKKFDIKPLHE